MTILIVGDPEDLTAVYVGFRAEERGERVLRLSESGFGVDWGFSLDDRAPAGDVLHMDGEEIPLDSLSGAYVRFHHAPEGPLLEELGGRLAELYIGQRRGALHLLLDRLPCPVVNPPFAGHANGSKPFQMGLLEAAGLNPPKWMTSNEPERIRAFARAFVDGLVVKSCSGLRSEVRGLDDEFLERVAEGSPPVIVQQRIRGDDVRVHTVRERAFPTRVTVSDAADVDYRFSEGGGRYEETEVPDEVADACRRYAESEGLVIAGFDFKVGSDGTWWCLECNPVPTFLPYEMETSQPICAALLDVFGSERS